MSGKNSLTEKKILIANGHAILREKLGQVISDINDTVVVAEAVNGDEAIDLVRNRDLDMVILDIDVPGRNVLEILGAIKASKPALPVLMLSMFPEKQYAGSLFKSGADGYITMDKVSDYLREAINTISQGGKYFCHAPLNTLTIHNGNGRNKGRNSGNKVL